MSLGFIEVDGVAVGFHYGATENVVDWGKTLMGPYLSIEGPVTRRGIYMPVMVCHPGLNDVNVNVAYLAALIDTGAEISAISDRIASMLGLPRERGPKVSTPSGIVEGNMYRAGLCVPFLGVPGHKENLTIIAKDTPLVSKANGSVSTDLLIGMDIIAKYGLLIDPSGVPSWKMSLSGVVIDR